MSGETARLRLAELPEGQAMNAAEINTVLGQLDALVDCCLQGVFVNTPPAGAVDGDVYLVGGSPGGAWGAEFTYKLACRRDGAWEPVIPFDGLRAFVPATNAFLVHAGGVWTDWNALIGAAESSIASAATCDIGAAGSLFLAITGTTTITSFGTAANRLRFLRFAGALTLTHNAASLVLPGGASIVTAAGDAAIFASDAGGHWRCHHYSRASGMPAAPATGSGALVLSASPALTGTASLASASFTGNVTLGAASGSANWMLGANGGGILANDGTNTYLNVPGAGTLYVVTGGSTAGTKFGTVSATGNLMWGTTANGGWSGNAAASFQASSAGYAASFYQQNGAGAASIFRVDGSAALAVFNCNGSTVGSVSTNGSAVAYNTTSDARLKAVAPRQTDYRDAIRALWVGDFIWKDGGAPGFGVLAQQAWEVMPNHQGVTRPEAEGGVWSASAEPFAHLALWGVKDIYVLVEALAARVAVLEAAHAAG